MDESDLPPSQWIENDEPPAVELRNPQGKSRVVLTCEHASPQIPRRLGTLGLSEEDRMRHIGWDKGIAVVAQQISDRLNAPLIISGYSRLVIDCNRRPNMPQSIPEISDMTIIPGNLEINDEEQNMRADALFWPYHKAVHDVLEARAASQPIMISMHSFTPVLQGQLRPWDIGLTYRHDMRLAEFLMNELTKEVNINVGNNQPYSVELETDYAIPVHAERRGISNCLIEIRQDHIEESNGSREWASRLTAIIRLLEENPNIGATGTPAKDIFEERLPIGDKR
tara:strand:- start:1882 stop:2727 length:846 start_codon:yes stop_codon:yes gene_type:complete